MSADVASDTAPLLSESRPSSASANMYPVLPSSAAAPADSDAGNISSTPPPASHREMASRFGGGARASVPSTNADDSVNTPAHRPFLTQTGGGMQSGGMLSLPQLLRSNYQFSSNIGLARVAFGGWVVGCVLAASLMLAWYSSAMRQFAIYLVFLAAFHTLEFVLTAIYHPNDLTYSSFLLDHSREFHLAMLVSWAEYWLESWLIPDSWRAPGWVEFTIRSVGFAALAGGQVLRSAAMATAAQSFTHQVADGQKKQQHVLITHGVYRFCRHPAYSGWFAWSLGTQLWLFNPICLIGYALVVWKFFHSRINYEEAWLFRFFGDAYREYHTQVPFSGVPFVKTPRL